MRPLAGEAKIKETSPRPLEQGASRPGSACSLGLPGALVLPHQRDCDRIVAFLQGVLSEPVEIHHRTTTTRDAGTCSRLEID